eukprot:scaffold930_cov408-Prasinococcus_capsulatus_cf.AAC.6
MTGFSTPGRGVALRRPRVGMGLNKIWHRPAPPANPHSGEKVSVFTRRPATCGSRGQEESE